MRCNGTKDVYMLIDIRKRYAPKRWVELCKNQFIMSMTTVMMTSSNGNIFRVTGPFCGNSPVPVKSPHKCQWRGALMFSLIYAWINDWVNNREAGDLRRHRGHYDVTVMIVWHVTWYNTDCGKCTSGNSVIKWKINDHLDSNTQTWYLLMYTSRFIRLWCEIKLT